MFNITGKSRICTIGLVTVCAMSALLYGVGTITAEAEDLPVEPEPAEKVQALIASAMNKNAESATGAQDMHHPLQATDDDAGWRAYAGGLRSGDPFVQSKQQGERMKGLSVAGLYGRLPSLANATAGVESVAWLVDSIKSGLNISAAGGVAGVADQVSSLWARLPAAAAAAASAAAAQFAAAPAALAPPAAAVPAAGSERVLGPEPEERPGPPLAAGPEPKGPQAELPEWEAPRRSRGHGGSGRRPGLHLPVGELTAA